MKRFEELRDEFAPVYDGTTCSSAKVNAWKDGADWAYSTLKSEHDRLEAMCEKLAGEVQCREKGEFGVPCSAGWPNNPGDWCRCCKALAEYRAMKDQTKMPCPGND